MMMTRKRCLIIFLAFVQVSWSIESSIPYGPVFPLGPVPLQVFKRDDYQYDGVIQVGGFMVYGKDPQGLYALASYYSIQGWKLWEHMVNVVRDPPGLTINGLQYMVNLTVINIGVDLVYDLHNVCNLTIAGAYGEYDILFGPITSLRTIAISQCTNDAKRVLVAPFVGTIDAFSCGTVTDYPLRYPCTAPNLRRFKYMWSMNAISTTFWDNGFNLFKLKGARTIGVWSSNDSFLLFSMAGSEDSAVSNGLVVLTTSMHQVTKDNIFIINDLLPSLAELRVVFSAMKSLDPDIIISGVKVYTTCNDVITVLSEIDYIPRAMGLWACLGVISGPNTRYFMDYTSWAADARGTGFNDIRDWKTVNTTYYSNEFFNDYYYNFWGNYSNGYSANAYVTGYAFESALEKAQSLDNEKLNVVFPLVQEPSIYGIFGFNGFGINDKKTTLLIQYDQGQVIQIISPLGSATNDFIFPFPLWSVRTFVSNFLGTPAEIVMFVLFFICIGFTAICLAILIKNWKARAIVASSPIFLSIMLIGSILVYCTVPVWMLYTDVVSCHLRLWFLNLGFTLLFGTLAAKTHRIKTLFMLKKMRPKKFSDKKLLIIVGVLVSIDVLLLILWSAVTQPTVTKVIFQGTGMQDGRLWQNLNFNECYWGEPPRYAMNIFYGLEGSYKALMVLYGVYLSALLWKYGSSMWVESKQIIFAMYNLIIFAFIGIALQLSLGTDNTSSTRLVLFITRSMCIFLSGTITVGAILIPRLLDPQGDVHEGKDATGTKRTLDTAAVQLSDLEWKYEILEKKYKGLKAKYKTVSPDDPEISEDKAQ